MPPTAPIDLRLNYPLIRGQASALQDALHSAGLADFEAALRLPPYEGPEELRAAAARFLSLPDYPLSPDQIVVATGGHHALLVALLAASIPGATLAVDPLTYPGLIAHATLLSIRLLPCPADQDGLLPDALRDLCRRQPVAAVYTMPTVHNPLGTVMPLERRAALIAVAREQGLLIIEDDAYGFLEAAPPPSFAHLAPDLAFYIYSLSKPAAPGIRTAFLHLPHRFFEPAVDALRLSSSGAVPLLNAVATRWLRQGIVASWIQTKREEAAQRQQLARRILAGLPIAGHPTSYHLWLALDAGRSAAEIVTKLASQGIAVSPGATFTVAPAAPPNAFRISLGGEIDPERVAIGLSAIAACISSLTHG